MVHGAAATHRIALSKQSMSNAELWLRWQEEAHPPDTGTNVPMVYIALSFSALHTPSL